MIRTTLLLIAVISLTIVAGSCASRLYSGGYDAATVKSKDEKIEIQYRTQESLRIIQDNLNGLSEILIRDAQQRDREFEQLRSRVETEILRNRQNLDNSPCPVDCIMPPLEEK